jgi:uncharacterized protein YuzE
MKKNANKKKKVMGFTFIHAKKKRPSASSKCKKN